MEKKAITSSRDLYNCHSLAELVGFIILEFILQLVTRLHRLSLRFFTYSSRARCTGECKNISNKSIEDQEFRREDVEIVMERLGMPLSHGSNKIKDCIGFDEFSTIFEEKEPSLEEVKEAFSIFDENCDGFIDAGELQEVLRRLGFREGEDLDACHEMIKKFDDNKDGKIDFSEFARFMESSFC